MHDPLNLADLVHDEFRQRLESGFDVERLQAAVAEDTEGLTATYLETNQTRRGTGGGYEEPEGLADVIDAMPARSGRATSGAAAASLADRIHGGWLCPDRRLQPQQA